MGLFGRRSPDSGPALVSQRSLALSRLLSLLPDQNASVLDLGAANPQNIKFFTERRASITVADLYRSAIPARRDGVRPKAVFRKLLAYGTDAHFDLVLTWDLLNYLKLEELSHLMEGLEPYLRAGSNLHALVSGKGEMPQAPSTYRIENENTLGLEPFEGASRPSPGYLEPTLLKQMPGLSVESRYQLKTGAVEYGFSYRKKILESGSAFRETSSRSRLSKVHRLNRAPSR